MFEVKLHVQQSGVGGARKILLERMAQILQPVAAII